MKRTFQEYLKETAEQKRRRAAYHEAGHAVVAQGLDESIRLVATIDGEGAGEARIRFSPETKRETMFRVGVAGFLAEAKTAYGDLSRSRQHIAEMAQQVFLHLTGVEPVGEEGEFQVDVHRANGQRHPAGTDLDDFHFVLSEIKNRLFSFLSMVRFESLPRDIQSAIDYCLARFDNHATWENVQAKADVLINTGELSI
jgi:hypothetical protein